MPAREGDRTHAVDGRGTRGVPETRPWTRPRPGLAHSGGPVRWECVRVLRVVVRGEYALRDMGGWRRAWWGGWVWR